MNQDKYVFAQLVEFLNNDKFRRLVDKYDGNRYVLLCLRIHYFDVRTVVMHVLYNSEARVSLL